MSSVSFVVPVFNKSSYLKHVVNSISSQKGDFDKEYIFIDDGSTDPLVSNFEALNVFYQLLS